MEYKNVKDFLKKEHYHSAGSVYRNVLIKTRIYYKLPNEDEKSSWVMKHSYVNLGLRYEKFTLFGKLLGVIIIAVIVLGLFILGLLTGQFKEIFQPEAYKENEVISSIAEDMVTGSPYSKRYNSCYSFDIPTCVPTNMYAKYLKKTYRIAKWYTHKTKAEKDLLSYEAGVNSIALLRLGIADDYWKKLKLKLIEDSENED